MRLFLQRLLAHFPTKLPQGVTEFNAWTAEILALAKLPNNDSMQFALSVAVLHADAKYGYRKKIDFVNVMIKGAANQVAGGIMQDLKDKQKAEQEAAALAAQTPVADTTPEANVPDVKPA